MHTLIFAGPKYDLNSLLILTLIIVLIVGGCFLWALFVKYVIHGKQYVANRAKAETIANWEYSAAEWQRYAGEFELGTNPVGAAKVRITPLDLWFTDDSQVLRKPIASSIMMVTDCRYFNNFLKIRIRSHSSSGRNEHYHYRDYSIPVPADKSPAAIEVLEFFKNIIAANPKKLDWVTPPATNIGLFGEIDF